MARVAANGAVGEIAEAGIRVVHRRGRGLELGPCEGAVLLRFGAVGGEAVRLGGGG